VLIAREVDLAIHCEYISALAGLVSPACRVDAGTQTMRTGITQLLLVAMLLLGQFAMAQHQQDHADLTDSETCQLCLLSAGLEYAPVDSVIAYATPAVAAFESDAYRQHPGRLATTGYLARAPPHSLLAP
jgi:hypothetical protein